MIEATQKKLREAHSFLAQLERELSSSACSQQTSQPERLKIGDGRISGYLSIFLALISLGAVACFHFPEFFTTPEFRALYPVTVIRYVLLGCLVLSFGFALTSFLLSKSARLAFAGMLISALAIVLGGTGVEVRDLSQSVVSISLDWLLIDILVLSAVFIPIELFFPQRAEQTKLHLEWKTDLVYFAVGHLLVQMTAILSATQCFRQFCDPLNIGYFTRAID